MWHHPSKSVGFTLVLAAVCVVLVVVPFRWLLLIAGVKKWTKYLDKQFFRETVPYQMSLKCPQHWLGQLGSEVSLQTRTFAIPNTDDPSEPLNFLLRVPCAEDIEATEHNLPKELRWSVELTGRFHGLKTRASSTLRGVKDAFKRVMGRRGHRRSGNKKASAGSAGDSDSSDDGGDRPAEQADQARSAAAAAAPGTPTRARTLTRGSPMPSLRE